MNPTQDKIKGHMNDAVGTVKETVGNVIGNEKLQAEGQAQSIKGETQKTVGVVKEAIQHGLQASGDMIELAGKKLEEAGMKKLGEIVHNVGDKVEHLAD